MTSFKWTELFFIASVPMFRFPSWKTFSAPCWFLWYMLIKLKVPMTRNKFHPKCLWLHCKDHLKWLNNLFYRILVTCYLFKIFNVVSYANITGVTSHHIMSFQKSIVFLTNTYLKKLKTCPCICINLITGN
jgi:hypothetical protein